MAVTYKKALKSLSVKVHGVDDAYVVADTVDETVASYALAEFERMNTMHLALSNKTVLVPFHAVEAVEVTVTESANQTRDAYGCDD